MTLARKTQIGLLITTLVLFVLLFLAPKTHTSEKLDKNALNIKQLNTENIEPFLTIATKSLKPADKVEYDKLINEANSSKVDTAYLTVVQYWDSQKRPDFASYYFEKIANKQQSYNSYLKAGNRYYYAIKFIKDNAEIEILYKSAIRCYNKAIEKDANGIDAKIQLAACFVEEGKDPMKGISLLKEIEKVDSNNVKLQLTFAFFSVKSGQIDKAIKRFDKVLQIDPLFIEAYLHLADAYEQQGNTNKTIEMLSKYASLTNDAMAKQEVIKYIDQLKKVNN